MENTTEVMETGTPTATDAEWEASFSEIQTDDADEIDSADDAEGAFGAEDDGEKQPSEDVKNPSETEADATDEQAKDIQQDGDTSQPAVQPETFELKSLGQIRQVTREEIIPLAQKGLDYDGVKADRDALREVTKDLESFYDNAYFVNSVIERLAKEAKMSPQEAAEQLLINTYVGNGYTEQQAKRQVEIDKREAEQGKTDGKARYAKAKQGVSEKEEADRKQDMLAFLKKYPDVKPDKVPKDVWQMVKNGKSLVESYEKYQTENKLKEQNAEIERLKKDLETAKTNSKNKARAVGSLSTAGKGEEKDPFLSAFMG